MCKYKNFDNLMELSIEEIQKHINNCNECRPEYSELLKIIYPDINLNMKIKKYFSFSFTKLSIVMGVFIIIFIITLPFIMNKNRKLDYTYLLNDSDIMQAVDSMNEEDFIELFYSLKEEL